MTDPKIPVTGLYTPESPLPNFDQTFADYGNQVTSEMAADDFKQSLVDGQSITDLISQAQYYQDKSSELLAQGNPQLGYGAPGAGNVNLDMNRTMQSIQEFANPKTASMFAQGQSMDLGPAKDLNRYTQSDDFQTFGYTPFDGEEQEFKYGRAMTWGDTIGKALGGGSLLAYDTFMEGWKGWGRMAEALFTWDSSKLQGSPEEQYEIAQRQEDILNKYAIYDTETSKDSLWNRQFFGNMLQQSGFAVGAGLQFVMENYLTAGLASVAGAATKSIALGRAFKNTEKVGELINDTRKVMNTVTKTERVTNTLGNIAKTLVPLYGTTTDLAKLHRAGAGAVQLGMAGIGGIKRELSLFNMSRSEAIFESAGTYKQLKDQLTEEYIAQHGTAPDAIEQEKINKKAEDASHDNFWTNVGVLTVMNRIQFDNMLKSFNTTRKVFDKGVSDLAEQAFEVTGKIAGKTEKRAFQSGMFGRVSAVGDIAKTFGKKTAAWEATKSVGRGLMKFETSEGVQELIQSASSEGLTQYYADLYHGKKGYTGRLEATMDSIRNPLTDMEGAKTFLMGALTGRLIAPFNSIASNLMDRKGIQERKKKASEAISTLNAFYANPTAFKREWIANVKIQNKAAESMEEAARNQNRYVFYNHKDSAFAKTVATAIKLNMFESLRDTIQELGADMTNEEFQKAFNIDPTSQNRKDVKGFMNEISSQIEDYYTTYYNLKDKYADRVIPDVYKNNDPKVYKQAILAKTAVDDAIEMLATNVYKSRQAVKRASQLQTEIAENTNLGGSSLEVLTKLGSEQAIDQHIEMLEMELKSYAQAETLTPEQKKLYKEKKEELELSQRWKDSYDEIMMNDDASYSPAAEGRAYESYAKLVSLFNDRNKQDIAVSKEDADDLFIKITDYIKLNRDNKNYVDAMNTLADPFNMKLIVQSLQSSMEEVNNLFRNEHEKEIEEAGKGPEENNESGKKEQGPVKQQVEEQDGPSGLGPNDVVIKSADGMYLIGSSDEEANTYYYIANKNNEPVGDITLSAEKFPTYNPNEVYDSREQAEKIFDALVAQKNKDNGTYTFDGKSLKAGDILVDTKGRKHRVVTKGSPRMIKGVPHIAIQPVVGSTSTTTINSLKGFTPEAEFEAAPEVAENPNAFKLQRNNELVRVYPARNENETPEEAAARFRSTILSFSKEYLLSNLTIEVVKNENLSETSVVRQGEADENPRLQQNPETHAVKIMFAGQPLGYATFHNRFSYVGADGKVMDLSKIDKKQFLQIFDPAGKDVNKEFENFKKNVQSSKEFFTALMAELGDKDSVTISSEKAAELFTFIPSAGEYAFVPKGEQGIPFSELDYTSIRGEVYILDRRTKYIGDGMYEDDTTVHTTALGTQREEIDELVKTARYENGEDKLKNYGRYVAVVQLPNGAVKFIELQNATVEKMEMDHLADEINKLSKNLKETNLTTKVNEKTKKEYIAAEDPTKADDFNSTVSSDFYIAVPGRRGMKVNLSVTPTGDVRIEFAQYTASSKKPILYEPLIIKESSKDPNVPLALKGSTDLLERINRAIADHDANPDNIIRKIGTSLTAASFKRSMPKDMEIEAFTQLTSQVEKGVVKNEGLFFQVKKGGANVKDAIIKSQAKKTEAPSNQDLSKIEVPGDVPVIDPTTIKPAQAETKSVVDQLQELEDQRDALISQIEGELLAEGKTRKEVRTHDYDADPRVAAINQQIADINNSAAFKVADNLTEQNVEDINSFKTWVKENLPESISVEDLTLLAQNMKQGGMTVGMFYTHMSTLNSQIQGKIAVGPESAFKYHEAFHGVFRMLLSDQKIDQLLDIARKEIKEQGKSIAQLKKELVETRPGFYGKMTDKQLEERVLEEYLADRFDAWKSDIKTPTSPVNKGIFRKILDFIKSFFKALTKREGLEDLFTAIDKGAYKNSPTVRNRFTSDLIVGITEPAFKSIQIGTRVVENEEGQREQIPQYLSEQESNVLTSTIAAVYHRRMMQSGLKTHSEEVMDEILDDYADLYDLKNNPYYQSDEFMDLYPNTAAQKKAEQKIQSLYKIFSGVIGTKDAFGQKQNLREMLKDAIRVHTKIMGYTEQELQDAFDEQVDEYGDRVSTDNWKESYSIGGYGSLSKELRQYLATVVDETTDEFGNTKFLNGEPIVEAVNANVLYNGILKAVAGSVSQDQLLLRMQVFAQHNPEAKKFWNKFTQDVDMIFDDQGNFVDIGNKKQANLFQAVIKGFQQFSVDYYFINKDLSKATARISEANRKGAAKNQFSIWYNAFIRKFIDEYDTVQKDPAVISAFMQKKTSALNDLATILKKGNTFTDAKVDAAIEKIVISLRNELGINLSPLFLKYSYLTTVDPKKLKDFSDNNVRILKAFEGVEPMTEEDAVEIASVIKSGKNPFGTNIDPQKLQESNELKASLLAHETKDQVAEAEQDATEGDDSSDDVDSAMGRLTRIAGSNAVFDEQVSTTSYKNAEGELVYSHQLPTFNLVRANELQDANFREELKKDPFLSTNFLLNNPLFNYIADQFKIARIDGIKDSILKANDNGQLVEDKRLNVNRNEGVTYGSMSDREFLITLFELYGKNTKHVIPAQGNQPKKTFMTAASLLGVLEASNTGDVVNLPVIKSVLYDGGKIKLSQDAENALIGEIAREFERIARANKEIQTIEAGGTVEGGIIEGYHTGDKRGLAFIKTGNMLGAALSQELRNAAIAGESIEEFTDQIKSQIDKYWLGDGGKVDNMISTLMDLKAISEDKDGKLQNHLLNAFVFGGFKTADKTDKERNNLLNIIPAAPRYNLAQILVNNYINTLAARQLFIGDAAQNFKNDGGIDEVKRNKGLNGSGASTDSMITAPELGIMHANKKSHVVTFADPLYRGQFAGKNKEKADAQMWMTVKSLRYTLFGLGKLNAAQAELLDKIERGESVTVEDVFGEVAYTPEGKKLTKGGSIAYNAQTNSIKLVYNDGQKYVKTSGVVLTKELTSVRNSQGEWVARPGNEELHELREKLETFERRNETITYAIPKSASKGKKTNVADNIAGINDNNFVEHDNRFWRLQLENPSNKTTITDPTQAKQLIIAEQERDMIVNFNGEQISLGEVIDNYLKNTEQRVKNNFFSARSEMFDIKGAFKELRTSLQQEKISPKLGKFLANAVKTLASSGADAQLLEFFQPMISPTGEYLPKYNLNHPITLDKFTQLFLAYFSKGVMSEKVPGHSLALMSNYGMKVVKRVIELDENGQPKRWEVIKRADYEADGKLLTEANNGKRWNNELDRKFEGLQVGDIYIDDLRHNVPEYDEKGNITGYFTEFMMPPHFKEHMKEYLKNGILSEDVLKAFGVRIPSQDKHSFVALKLVDFLPAHYGSTGVFPHELIEISGADFDIDKLYMHIVDAYVKDGKRVAYGTAKTNEEKFQEYVTYLKHNNKEFKEKLRQLRDASSIANETVFYEDEAEWANDLFVEDYNNVLYKTALAELGLPLNADAYAAYVKKYGEQNNGVLNNQILDAKIKLLNNEGVVTRQRGETPIAFQVAEVQPLLDAIESFTERFPILKDVLVETGEDVDSMLGQYKAFKNNKEGARNIGPAVNSMLVFAVMNAFNVQIRKQNAEGTELFSLTIDGHEYNTYGNTRAFSNRKVANADGTVTDSSDYDGERIFYHISALVSAMTDNAKERLAARLGLNINAIGVVANMVSLGVPLETALMFNLQPSVRKFYAQLSARTKNIKTAAESKLSKNAIIKGIQEDLEKNLPKEDPQIPEITTSLLENNIKSGGSNAEAEVAIFNAFVNFYNQTEYYSAVAQVLKLSKGLGTSNEDIDKIEEKEEMLGLNMTDEEFEKSNIPFDLRQVLKGTDPKKPFHRITANYIAIKNQIKQLQKSLFIERTKMFEYLKNAVKANLDVHLKEKQNFDKTLKRDLIAYLGIKAYMQYLKVNGKSVKLAGLDNAMIYDAAAVERGDGFMDVIDTVKSIREQLPENYFATKFLNIVPVVLTDVNSNKEYINPKTKGGINVAESNTWAKLNALEQSRLEDSFVEIYSNPKTRPLALNLFNYLIVKDGGQFKSGSFIKFIPPAMFKELLDATGKAHDVLKVDDLINDAEAYKEVFGVTAQELFNEFTHLYTTNINNAFNIHVVKPAKSADKELLAQKPSKNYTPEVLIHDKDKGTLRVSLFGGIRKAEPTLVTDQNGNEFYLDMIPTGKFSDEEIQKLDYNRKLLKIKGFNTVAVEEEGQKKYKLALPYTIKINVSDGPFTQYEFYRLSRVGKKSESAEGLGDFLVDLKDGIASESDAMYVKFEPTGSKKQWAVGGVTGEMPSSAVLRKRTAQNKKGWGALDDAIDAAEKAVADIDRFFSGVSSIQLSDAVQTLGREYGIGVRMVGNKITYFTKEKGKEVPYETDVTTPEELLNLVSQMPVEERTTPINYDAISSTNVTESSIESINFGNVTGAPEETEGVNFKDLIAKKKKLNEEIEKNRDDFDKNCPLPNTPL